MNASHRFPSSGPPHSPSQFRSQFRPFTNVRPAVVALGLCGALWAVGCGGTAEAAGSTTPLPRDTMSTSPTPPGGTMQLGAGASLGGARPFPADNAWNQDVSAAPVDANSATLVARCGTGALKMDVVRMTGVVTGN